MAMVKMNQEDAEGIAGLLEQLATSGGYLTAEMRVQVLKYRGFLGVLLGRPMPPVVVTPPDTEDEPEPGEE